MINVINEYIEKYKKDVLKTIEEFGYKADLKIIETMAQNRKNIIIDGFDNGIGCTIKHPKLWLCLNRIKSNIGGMK